MAVSLLGTSITAIAEGSYIISMNNGVWENKNSKGAIRYTSSDGNEVVFDSKDLDTLAQNITENKESISNLSTVATTGSFNDLLNKPEIPTIDSELNIGSDNAISNKAVSTGFEEINNSLSTKLPSEVEGFSVVDGHPYITYKVGADSVTKKLGDGVANLTLTFTLSDYAWTGYSNGGSNTSRTNSTTTTIKIQNGVATLQSGGSVSATTGDINEYSPIHGSGTASITNLKIVTN